MKVSCRRNVVWRTGHGCAFSGGRRLNAKSARDTTGGNCTSSAAEKLVEIVLLKLTSSICVLAGAERAVSMVC